MEMNMGVNIQTYFVTNKNWTQQRFLCKAT